MSFIVSLVFLAFFFIVSVKRKKKGSIVYFPLFYVVIFASFATVPSRYTVLGLSSLQALTISLVIGLMITCLLVFLGVRYVKGKPSPIPDAKILIVTLPTALLCVVNGILLFWEYRRLMTQ